MQALHLPHRLQSMQEIVNSVRTLLNARQVQDILHVDRSTVYRMAETGRLPAIRVGRQWRFPADEIQDMVSGGIPHPRDLPAGNPGAAVLDRDRAEAVIAVAAELLGVMMLVTDMDGRPITSIANPCPWFVTHGDDPQVMAMCTEEWRQLADDHHFEPRFDLGEAGFECARGFIRTGRELTGMVLAGGICPEGTEDPELYDLTDEQRQRVLRALPGIAVAISRSAPADDGAHTKERT